MNYIVFDLEWNQGEGGRVTSERDVPFEIIEIGAVKLNSDKVMIDEFSALIKPQIYKTMHYVTGKLIHLKMQELKFEKPFTEVFANFMDWCGEDYVFCTWGPLDLTELQRNMTHYNIPAFSDRPFAFYDVQKLYALECDESRTRKALETAVDEMKIEKDIPFHRAFSDAYYTAKVFAMIHRTETLKHYSYDVYTPPIDKKHEIYNFFGDYDKLISKAYESRDELLKDRQVRNTNCYLCKSYSRKKVPLFTPTNGKYYLSMAYCETHGFVKTKIRVRRSDDGRYFAVKTRKIISADDANLLSSRYTKIRDGKKSANKHTKQ